MPKNYVKLLICTTADLSTKSINILGILELGSIFWMNLISLEYLKLDILARLGAVYLKLLRNIGIIEVFMMPTKQ